MLNNLHIALRSLFKKGRNNIIKIVSLGIGLAVGLVLVSKVYFDLSYDGFYPDHERIYLLQQNYRIGDDKKGSSNTVSGGIAPGMKAEIPEVEAATRFDYVGDFTFITADKSKYKASFIMADTSFFDVLSRPLLSGNPKDVLARPMYAMVSETIAGNIGKGEDVVGQTILLNDLPGAEITIGGVFEDIPENSHYKYDIVVSLASSEYVYGEDTTNEWFMSDRYYSYLKVYPGTDSGKLEAAMAQVMERHLDKEVMKKNGIEIKLNVLPLSDIHKKIDGVKQMILMLSLIAFVLLFTSVMNYVLVVLSSLVSRTKEIAVHKCYGASGKNIAGMIFSETFIHLLAAILLAILLVLFFRETVIRLLGTSLEALFNMRSALVLTGVCLLIFLVAATLTSRLFVRIPVATAFRTFRESGRSWKRILLSAQFVAAGFLVALLAIVGIQYNRMINDETGYDYSDLLYANLLGVDPVVKHSVMEELRRLPEVKSVSTCSELPMYGGGGNLVYAPGSNESVLGYTDLEEVDADYISLMNMQIVQGNNFVQTKTDSLQVMVSQLMADKLAAVQGWSDGVVGKYIRVSGHDGDQYTIVGVYDNIHISSLANRDENPSAIFYSAVPSDILLVKLHQLTSENRASVENVIRQALPDYETEIRSYKADMVNLYRSSRLFRDAILIGGCVILALLLIGLIGYVNDEINRRNKEIALRKINGATSKEILSLISFDVAYIAVPTVVMGVGISYFVGEKWLEQFADKIGLSPSLFIFSTLSVLVIILATILIRSWKAANDNPVESLKSE